MSENHTFDGVRRDPINREAAMMFAKGVKQTSRITLEAHWVECPPLMNKVKVSHYQPEDFTGKVVGRLTVVGLSREKIAQGPRWIVRCTCGEYEARKSKIVANSKNPDDCCVNCRPISKKRHRL